MDQGVQSRMTTGLLGQRIFVTISLLVCVVGTLFGIGVLGKRVEESSGGALAADATLLAPAGPAFSIWSVIYLGLAAYTIWQWFGVADRSLRERRTGWLAGVSMLLNAAWLLVTQQGWIWLSVLVIFALVVVLGMLVRNLADSPGHGPAERIVVDGTFGLYLGWVTVATCANVSAAGAASGISLGASGDQVIAVVVLLVAAAIGVVLAVRLGGRIAVAAALAWGLAWIAVGRLADGPLSVPVAAAAVVAALIVIAATLVARMRSTTRPVGAVG
ncbi:TspO/MBR family protein [Raineyella antarctica]|nr:TspO/MBR family protein [Raineyella antarctica]